MAYTTPRTWTAGEKVTAAQMNEQLRDNMAYVYGRQPFEKLIWIANLQPTVTGGAGTPSKVEMGTNKNVYDYLPFDGGTVDEYAYANVPMPDDYDGGTVTGQFYWSYGGTPSNHKTAWGLQAVAISDADALDVAQGVAAYANDVGGAVNILYKSPETAAVTIAGSPAAGDLVQFRVSRHCSDTTNDTLEIDARLHGVLIRYGVS